MYISIRRWSTTFSRVPVKVLLNVSGSRSCHRALSRPRVPHTGGLSSVDTLAPAVFSARCVSVGGVTPDGGWVGFEGLGRGVGARKGVGWR